MAKKPKDDTTDGAAAAGQPGDQAGRPVKLIVVAKAPLWRGPPGWDKHWPAGETIVEGEELAAHDAAVVEAMIERLEEDTHFSVQVEREKAAG